MAHFAQIENGVVVNVLVVGSDDIGGAEFPESEPLGQVFLGALLPGTEWRQTSFNRNFRKNYAGIGYIFDAQRDAFIPPQPDGAYVLDEVTCQWRG